MCHAWEYELIKKAHLEQVARRNREIAKAPKPEPAPAAPARTGGDQPRKRDPQSVPA
jgi:hypothetical protein